MAKVKPQENAIFAAIDRLLDHIERLNRRPSRRDAVRLFSYSRQHELSRLGVEWEQDNLEDRLYEWANNADKEDLKRIATFLKEALTEIKKIASAPHASYPSRSKRRRHRPRWAA